MELFLFVIGFLTASTLTKAAPRSNSREPAWREKRLETRIYFAEPTRDGEIFKGKSFFPNIRLNSGFLGASKTDDRESGTFVKNGSFRSGIPFQKRNRFQNGFGGFGISRYPGFSSFGINRPPFREFGREINNFGGSSSSSQAVSQSFSSGGFSGAASSASSQSFSNGGFSGSSSNAASQSFSTGSGSFGGSSSQASSSTGSFD